MKRQYRIKKRYSLSGQQFNLIKTIKYRYTETAKEEYLSSFEQQEAEQEEQDLTAIQEEREQRVKEREKIQFQVTVDHGEQSERTTETGRIAPIQFVEADLEASECRKKEEKKNEEMAAWASSLREQRKKEAADAAKKLRDQSVARLLPLQLK